MSSQKARALLSADQFTYQQQAGTAASKRTTMETIIAIRVKRFRLGFPGVICRGQAGARGGSLAYLDMAGSKSAVNKSVAVPS